MAYDNDDKKVAAMYRNFFATTNVLTFGLTACNSLWLVSVVFKCGWENNNVYKQNDLCKRGEYQVSALKQNMR